MHDVIETVWIAVGLMAIFLMTTLIIHVVAYGWFAPEALGG